MRDHLDYVNWCRKTHFNCRPDHFFSKRSWLHKMELNPSTHFSPFLNYVIHHFPFIFSISSLWIFPFTPPGSLLNSWLFFLLGVVICLYVYVYTYVFLNIISSFFIKLFVLMLKGLALWYWMISGCPPSWRPFTPLSAFLIVYSMCVTLRPWGLSPIHFAWLLVLS